jgi:hypothetical protein
MEKAKKPRKKTNAKENLGKLLLDFSKLTFGSFILGGILRGELPQYIIIIAGLVAGFVCAFFGIKWSSKEVGRE